MLLVLAGLLDVIAVVVIVPLASLLSLHFTSLHTHTHTHRVIHSLKILKIN